jgi:hypothetical protein
MIEELHQIVETKQRRILQLKERNVALEMANEAYDHELTEFRKRETDQSTLSNAIFHVSELFDLPFTDPTQFIENMIKIRSKYLKLQSELRNNENAFRDFERQICDTEFETVAEAVQNLKHRRSSEAKLCLTLGIREPSPKLRWKEMVRSVNALKKQETEITELLSVSDTRLSQKRRTLISSVRILVALRDRLCDALRIPSDLEHTESEILNQVIALQQNIPDVGDDIARLRKLLRLSPEGDVVTAVRSLARKLKKCEQSESEVCELLNVSSIDEISLIRDSPRSAEGETVTLVDCARGNLKRQAESAARLLSEALPELRWM